MLCPNCGSSEAHRVTHDLRNLGIAIINTAWVLFQTLTVILVAHTGWALRRKCLNCGYRFLGPTPISPNFDECAGCGYNLTGNVSGRCSECGWKLPRRYRAWRRHKDRGIQDAVSNQADQDT